MTVQLDTSEVAPAKRSAFWAAGTARLLGPVGVRSLVERPFSGRILGHHLGPIEVFRVAGDANRVQRTAADVALLDPQRLHLNLLTRGTLLAAQQGRSSRLRAGDITSFDWSRPFVAQATGRFEILVFTVPLAMLGGDADRVRRRTALRLGGDGGLPQVAGPFFIGIAAGLHDGSIDPEDPVLADAIVGLVRALHGERQAQARALPRSVARADGLLQRIKDHIDLHLREPDLGPERIAKAHFISTRYVHELFQPEGTTVSAWIRARRLEGARRDLADPELAGLTISALAARWASAIPPGSAGRSTPSTAARRRRHGRSRRGAGSTGPEPRAASPTRRRRRAARSRRRRSRRSRTS
jgi:AraC-like DNA-binding protein